MNKISSFINYQSDSLLFPYEYARRHFSLACSKEVSWSQTSVHVLVGSLELIPCVNYIVAIAERSFAFYTAVNCLMNMERFQVIDLSAEVPSVFERAKKLNSLGIETTDDLKAVGFLDHENVEEVSSSSLGPLVQKILHVRNEEQLAVLKDLNLQHNFLLKLDLLPFLEDVANNLASLSERGLNTHEMRQELKGLLLQFAPQEENGEPGAFEILPVGSVFEEEKKEIRALLKKLAFVKPSWDREKVELHGILVRLKDKEIIRQKTYFKEAIERLYKEECASILEKITKVFQEKLDFYSDINAPLRYPLFKSFKALQSPLDSLTECMHNLLGNTPADEGFVQEVDKHLKSFKEANGMFCSSLMGIYENQKNGKLGWDRLMQTYGVRTVSAYRGLHPNMKASVLYNFENFFK